MNVVREKSFRKTFGLARKKVNFEKFIFNSWFSFRKVFCLRQSSDAFLAQNGSGFDPHRRCLLFWEQKFFRLGKSFEKISYWAPWVHLWTRDTARKVFRKKSFGSGKSFQTFLKTFFQAFFFVHCQSASGSFMNPRHRHFKKKVFRKKFFKKSSLPHVVRYGNPSKVYIREG